MDSENINNCSDGYCGYTGPAINVKYFKDGKVKSITCPVCFKKRITKETNFYIYKGGGTKQQPALLYVLFVWAVMLAIGGFIYALGEGTSDFLKGYVIINIIISLLAYNKIEKINSKNNYINNRIREYKITGKIQQNTEEPMLYKKDSKTENTASETETTSVNNVSKTYLERLMDDPLYKQYASNKKLSKSDIKYLKKHSELFNWHNKHIQEKTKLKSENSK